MANWMNKRPPKGFRYVPTNAEHVANIFTHGVSDDLIYSVFSMSNTSQCEENIINFLTFSDYDTDWTSG